MADNAEKSDPIISLANDKAGKDQFLRNEQKRILRIASKVVKHPITKSDDEWTIAMLAVSQAIDSYNAKKGDFWVYAGVVIRSRLTDHYRKMALAAREIAVQPAAFDGEIEEESNLVIQCEVRDQAGYTVNQTLKEEIEAVGQELSQYGFSFFDLAECSPKTKATRKNCAKVILAMFEPPPLVEELRFSHYLPIKSLLKRTELPRRLIDRHRRYLIAATVILAGDYPALAEYFYFIKREEGL